MEDRDQEGHAAREGEAPEIGGKPEGLVGQVSE